LCTSQTPELAQGGQDGRKKSRRRATRVAGTENSGPLPLPKIPQIQSWDSYGHKGLGRPARGHGPQGLPGTVPKQLGIPGHMSSDSRTGV
jgi:hypothetical protein